MAKRQQLVLFPDDETRWRLQGRILRNILVDAVTGCWRWARRKNNGGYPVMAYRVPGYRTPRKLVATRVSLEVFVGPPPSPEHEAAHDPERCPHTDCVNWRHLRWATREENEADKRHPRRLHVREIHPPLHRLFDGDEEIVAPF